MATITIDEGVLKKLEEQAVKENRSADEVANDMLRNFLEKPYKLQLQGWKTELRPGVDLNDRAKLYDLMDGDELLKKYGR